MSTISSKYTTSESFENITHYFLNISILKDTKILKIYIITRNIQIHNTYRSATISHNMRTRRKYHPLFPQQIFVPRDPKVQHIHTLCISHVIYVRPRRTVVPSNRVFNGLHKFIAQWRCICCVTASASSMHFLIQFEPSGPARGRVII